MQKSKKKFVSTVCIVLALVFILTLVLGAFSGAWAVSQSEIDALKNQQSAIQQQKKTLQGKISDLQGQQNSAIEQKTALDEQNELARQEIELISEQIDLYTGMVEEKAKELDEAKADEAAQKEALRVRMRAMEESGSLTYFSILFDSSSFSDLLARMDFISSIMQYDKDLENKYIAATQKVAEVKAQYEETLKEQQDKKTELEARKAELEQQIAEAEAVIANLEKDIEKYKTEYEANDSQEAAIRSQIDQKVAELQKQQEEAIKNGQTVVAGSGTLIWPVSGTSTANVSSGFGYRIHPIFGDKRFHSGVDISANSGTTIMAADAGTVVSAVYSSSYGNYVVLSHGNGMVTLYAHMSSMAVSSGQTVTKGQTIGYVGSTGWSTGPHCHFEIKVNGQLVDPLTYY
ncbi:MAG: peptidoglycan DD-metalloendopeptidase family protein [Oscillospiraceae bacterium]|nr:peptidoglycan DD-metalloendopeptidase family protein [Oscillospiraceae bacterium]